MKFDDFDANEEFDNFDHNLVHISRIQTRGRKCITTIRGIEEEFDLKKIVKFCKKNFKCHGHIREEGKEGKKKDNKDHEQEGPKKEEIVLSGDQSAKVKQFLVYMGITMEENIRVHGGN